MAKKAGKKKDSAPKKRGRPPKEKQNKGKTSKSVKPKAKAAAKKAPAKRGPKVQSKVTEKQKIKAEMARVNNDLVNYDSIVSDSEKTFDLISGSGALGRRQSTGVMSIDITLYGGLVGGAWYTFSGAEQSAKTTLALEATAQAAIDGSIPIIQVWDYEGSFNASLDYFLNIARKQGFKGTLEDMFGIEDPETGEVIKRGLVKKYQGTVLEKFFDNLKKIAKALPDKMERKGKWYLVFTPDKKDPLDAKRRAACHEKLYKKTGKYWIESDDAPQALFLVDSYPAMSPKHGDDKDNTDEALAAQARTFSAQLRRVKGYFADKKIEVLGINQLRAVPMAMYGPKEEEPGGNALKFYSDVRLRSTSRSSVFGIKGQVEEEKSVLHKGNDKYRYLHIKQIKNKLSVPHQETWARLWITDPKGQAWGYDPVFDCYYFMKQTGLLTSTENRKKIKFKNMHLIGIKDWDEKVEVKWMDIKKLVLGDKSTVADTFKSLKYKGKPFNLHKKLKAFCSTKTAYDCYIDQISGGSKGSDSDSDSDED